eukprot:Rmarinus@m.4827
MSSSQDYYQPLEEPPLQFYDSVEEFDAVIGRNDDMDSPSVLENRPSRYRLGFADVYDGNDEEEEDEPKPGNKRSSFSLFFVAFSLIFFLALYVMIFLFYGISIEPVGEHVSRASFSAERARDYLYAMTSVGSRYFGSPEAELTVEFLETVLESIQDEVGGERLQLWTQLASGSFLYDTADGEAFIYTNVTNVIAKVPGRDSGSGALLVNVHYDTTLVSGGAADGGSTTGIVLELISNLAYDTRKLEHDVIFVMNGGGNSNMVGAHGFITQHELRHQVRAFVDIKAAGVGGRICLFRAGKGNHWMAEDYSKAVSEPYGTVAAADFFANSLFPSGSDYNIYLEHGDVNLPGLQLVYINRGYIYHTDSDTVDNVSPSSVQHGGDSALAVIRELAEDDKLKEERSGQEEGRRHEPIYYDFLGSAMIAYSKGLEGVLHLTAIIVACFMLTLATLFKYREVGMPWVVIDFLLPGGTALLAALMMWVFAVSFAIAMGEILHALHPMSWYSFPWFIVFLYGFPSVFGVMCSQTLFRYAIKRMGRSDRVMESYVYWAGVLMWTMMISGLAASGLGLSYLALWWTVCPAAAYSFVIVTRKLFPEYRYTFNVWYLKWLQDPWMFYFVVAMALPTMFLISGSYLVFLVAVPIHGRGGSDNKADVNLAIIMSFVVSSICTIYAAFLQRLGAFFRVTAFLGIASLGMIVIALFFSPYSREAERYINVFHIYRPEGLRCDDFTHIPESCYNVSEPNSYVTIGSPSPGSLSHVLDWQTLPMGSGFESCQVPETYRDRFQRGECLAAPSDLPDRVVLPSVNVSSVDVDVELEDMYQNHTVSVFAPEALSWMMYFNTTVDSWSIADSVGKKSYMVKYSGQGASEVTFWFVAQKPKGMLLLELWTSYATLTPACEEVVRRLPSNCAVWSDASVPGPTIVITEYVV